MHSTHASFRVAYLAMHAQIHGAVGIAARLATPRIGPFV
jgi:hypothetical protein